MFAGWLSAVLDLLGMGGGTASAPVVPVSRRWVCRRAGLRWRCRAGRFAWRASAVADLVDNVIVKSPGDAIFRFAMDLSDFLRSLGTGVTVSTLTSVAGSPSGLTIGTTQVDSPATSVSALFSAGADGTDYDVTFTGTLSTGQTFERTGVLRVRKK